MDLVTSSQTLREKDIQPSKLNFGFLGLGKIYRQKDINNKDRQKIVIQTSKLNFGFWSYMVNFKIQIQIFKKRIETKITKNTTKFSAGMANYNIIQANRDLTF